MIELNRVPDGGERLAVEAPDASQRDEPVPVRVTGATPGETVELDATVEDPNGVTWRSTAAFTADADGVVDPAEQAPDAGSYEGAAPMGWCWSMTPDEDATVVALANAAAVTARLRATAGDREAETTVTLRTQSPGTTRERVTGEGGSGVVGTLYEPPGEGPHPGVLVLHGSGGGPLEGMAALLAGRGYTAFAVEYFGQPDPLPDEFARIPLDYLRRAAEWLRGRSAVDDGRLGVFGASRGGELALLLGARCDWVGAVVSYAGSGLALEAPAGETAAPWVDDGRPVPFLSMDEFLDPVDLPPPTEEGYRRSGAVIDEAVGALPDERRREVAFAVEDVDGPVFLAAGDDDEVWGPQLTRLAADRLRDCAFDHRSVVRVYEDAGHSITAPYLPTTGRRVRGGRLYGGTPRESALADADAWAAALDTLARGSAM